MQSAPCTTVVAIAGPSGSGKTTLANVLAQTIPGGAVVMALDSYYKDQRGVPEENINVDVPGAFEHHLAVDQLKQLMAGVPIQQPIYDYRTHERAPVRRTVPPLPSVIVEGIYALYWPELRKLFTTSVFLSLDHAVCLERRIERDTRERGRSRTAVIYQYERTVRPMYDQHIHPTREHATLVLDARASTDQLAARILRLIGSRTG
ncbi:MAG TPA: uridine kinase [Candidatus Krumholzibacteria bacterium]|nr:uridine kinase [Candidatus Krumholzibacteria bacterium]